MFKKFTISILALGFISVVYINLTAFPDGINDTTKRPGTNNFDKGCICHNETVPSPEVKVLFSGPTSVRAGDTATFKLKITGGPDSAGGCNIASYFGKLITSPLETHLKTMENVYYSGTADSVRKNELTHMAPKPHSNDTITFTFRYIAPNTPNVVDTLYACGNSVIVDHSTSDDKWNFADNRKISITSTGISNNSTLVKNFTLEQNYPNPFNPATKINFTLDKSALVSLTVYDINGKQISSVINSKNYSAGNYSVDFDAAKFNLNSGVYFYKLEANGVGEIKKMMLVK
ncbi:MAG: T9SS type A sorting domain-containing protein [Bacteroidetes bacterium]|nr:T9SS type A sorting domain-containing protein [Bacteroidota bacterium]MBX7045371.1 T9SS type A sorting domain-containing protein [Ignavibacteria bacterium]